MNDNIASKIEAAFFRVMGVALGVAACTALIVNNPQGAVFANAYGILFFVIFLTLGAYSTFSLVKSLTAQDTTKKSP